MNTHIWEDYEDLDERERLRRPAPAKPEETDRNDPLASFYADELIMGEPVVVKSGKEASLYCCQAHPRTGQTLLAAKVYRSRQRRSFKNDAVYQQGRTTLDSRLDRAIHNKSKRGREAQFSGWLSHEYGTLHLLHAAGADVPKPYGCGESALLIEYFGERGMAAPQLIDVELSPEEAPVLFEQLLHNLAIFLDRDRVHGDLSAYNILYWQGRLRIIDFPQSVDPMDNTSAYDLFVRDVENVCAHFALFGVSSEPHALALSLWLQSGRAYPHGRPRR